MYIRDELAPIEIGDLQRPGTESYVKILKCNIPSIIGVFYRPPNQSAVNRDITMDALRTQFDFLCVRSKLAYLFFYSEILMTVVCSSIQCI